MVSLAVVWAIAITGSAEPGWVAFAGLVTVLVAIFCPLKLRDAERVRKLFQSESEDGNVETFAFESGHELNDAIPERLSGAEKFEVHCGSGRVVRIDGEEPRAILRVAPREVAAVPSASAGQMMPRKMIFVPAGGMTALATRPLSADEREELFEILFRHSPARVWWGIPLCCYALFGASSSLFGPGRGEIGSMLVGAFMGIVSVRLGWGLSRLFRLWRRLKGDVSQDVVWALPPSALEEFSLRSAHAIEVLPVSQIVWSVDGVAAGWRKI